MAKIFQTTNPNAWLGTPLTARYVLPLTAGYQFGENHQDPEKAASSFLRVVGGQLMNAAATNEVGFVMLIPDAMYVAGQWVHSGTKFVDDTADAQDADADDFTTADTTQNNGFIIGSKIPFNIVSADVTTAAGGTPSYEVSYWGYPTTGVTTTTQWNIATLFVGSATALYRSTGENLFVANIMPNLMVRLDAANSAIANAPTGYYYIRVRATTAATTTATLISRVYIGSEIIRQKNAPIDTSVNIGGGIGNTSRTIQGGAALGSFWGTANDDNHMYLEFD